MKKLSVIIPVYNTTEFIEECLESVKAQTYSNIEVIIINDASNKECQSIIENIIHGDKRFVIYHLDEQKGVGFARNYGLDKATGDFIYFLDSDDYLEDGTIKQLMDNVGDYDLLSGEVEEFTKKLDKKNDHEPVLVIEKIENTKQFCNGSVLHRLISKKFIDKHQLRFSEHVRCYSDLAFIVPLMSEVKEAPKLQRCIYYKRVRNDPITNPSLSQIDTGHKISDFLSIYIFLKERYISNSIINPYLDKQFLNFYKAIIVRYIYSHKIGREFLERLSEAASKLETHSLKKNPAFIRSELKAIVKQNDKKLRRLIRMHVLASQIKSGYRSRTKMYLQLYRSVFTKFPLKEKTIVFESFLGKNYSDSPKYIYEYMLKNNYDYNYVWIFTDKNRKIPGNPKIVKRFSLAYYYYLGRSKYWVSNSRMPKHLNKRKGNVYLQTWHGTPLKRLVFDMKDVYSANPNYKQDFYDQSRRWDYLVSANQYSSDIFRSAFKYTDTMLEYGYPRNDVLYNENRDQVAHSLKQKLGIPADKKVILYAPTWRDDDYYGAGQYKFNLKLDLEKMYEELGNDYVIILRMHYFIADHIDIGDFAGFAYNLSKYDDIADLYLISDILITDYSSVFFDYSNLRRPILFFTYDLEKYRDTLRGFYIDIENEVPGPLLKTSDDVIDAIKNIDEIEKKYAQKYQTFTDKFCSWEKGTASEEIVKDVFDQGDK